MMVNCEDSYSGYGIGAYIILYPHALASVTFKTIECQNIRDEHKLYKKQNTQKKLSGFMKKNVMTVLKMSTFFIYIDYIYRRGDYL